MDPIKRAHELALKAKKNSYSPYSNFAVGACLKLKDGEEYFSGCNVENASFGATICAERNSIFQAVAKKGTIEVEFLLLVTNIKEGTYPCALCLQVFSEFFDAKTPIHIANDKEVITTYTLDDLIPKRFDKKQLDKN